jgi:hypothetical protein
MLRYGIALAIAALLIVAGVVFVRMTYAELNDKFEQQRQRSKEQKAAGTLPESMKDVDLDALRFDHFGMTVTRGFQRRLDIAGWLAEFWFLFAPLTILVSVGMAYVLGRVFSRHGG